VYYDTGRDSAREHWQRALELFEAMGTPERFEVTERLRSMIPAAELVDGVGEDRTEHGQTVSGTAGGPGQVDDEGATGHSG